MATELTTESYIGHHLTNLTCGKTPDGWTCDPYMVDKMGFWAFHVDSLFWSILLGALFITIFRLGIPKSTDSAPSGLQNIVEMCIEFVNDNVQSLFGSVKNTLIAPLALTVFVWILFMNLMDLVPVDFLPVLAGHIAYIVAGDSVGWISSPESFYFKVVPTTDPNITLGMAFAVFFLAEYANMILVAALSALMFMGGWLSPFQGTFMESWFDWVPGIGWLFLKTAFFGYLFLWFRATFPRYRYDQIMRLGWKVFIPITIVWILVVGLAVVYELPWWFD